MIASKTTFQKLRECESYTRIKSTTKSVLEKNQIQFISIGNQFSWKWLPINHIRTGPQLTINGVPTNSNISKTSCIIKTLSPLILKLFLCLFW